MIFFRIHDMDICLTLKLTCFMFARDIVEHLFLLSRRFNLNCFLC